MIKSSLDNIAEKGRRKEIRIRFGKVKVVVSRSGEKEEKANAPC